MEQRPDTQDSPVDAPPPQPDKYGTPPERSLEDGSAGSRSAHKSRQPIQKYVPRYRRAHNIEMESEQYEEAKQTQTKITETVDDSRTLQSQVDDRNDVRDKWDDMETEHHSHEKHFSEERASKSSKHRRSKSSEHSTHEEGREKTKSRSKEKKSHKSSKDKDRDRSSKEKDKDKKERKSSKEKRKKSIDNLNVPSKITHEPLIHDNDFEASGTSTQTVNQNVNENVINLEMVSKSGDSESKFLNVDNTHRITEGEKEEQTSSEHVNQSEAVRDNQRKDKGIERSLKRHIGSNLHDQPVVGEYHRCIQTDSHPHADKDKNDQPILGEYDSHSTLEDQSQGLFSSVASLDQSADQLLEGGKNTESMECDDLDIRDLGPDNTTVTEKRDLDPDRETIMTEIRDPDSETTVTEKRDLDPDRETIMTEIRDPDSETTETEKRDLDPDRETIMTEIRDPDSEITVTTLNEAAQLEDSGNRTEECKCDIFKSNQMENENDENITSSVQIANCDTMLSGDQEDQDRSLQSGKMKENEANPELQFQSDDDPDPDLLKSEATAINNAKSVQGETGSKPSDIADTKLTHPKSEVQGITLEEKPISSNEISINYETVAEHDRKDLSNVEVPDELNKYNMPVLPGVPDVGMPTEVTEESKKEMDLSSGTNTESGDVSEDVIRTEPEFISVKENYRESQVSEKGAGHEGANAVAMETEAEEDSWDALFDDNGDALDASLMEEVSTEIS